MKNFDYGKKYHYMVKYLLIAFPILLLIVSLLSYNSQYNSVLTLLSGMTNEFLNIPFNSWWTQLLSIIGLDNLTNELLVILTAYPLYVLWVYIFDIFLDVFAIIPRIAHKLLSKVGGDY